MARNVVTTAENQQESIDSLKLKYDLVKIGFLVAGLLAAAGWIAYAIERRKASSKAPSPST